MQLSQYGVRVIAGIGLIAAYSAFAQHEVGLTTDADEEKDFLFLAEEEPTKAITPVLDDSDDEGAVIKQAPQKKAAPKKLENDATTKAEHPYGQRDKIEDLKEQSIISPIFTIKKKTGEMTISGKYKPEIAYARNLSLLNSCNPFDRLFLVKHTFDLNIEAKCGLPKYDNDAAHLKCTLRNKGVWGNTFSIAPTTESSVKDIDVTFGGHKHSLGKHVVWVRELWLKTLINAVIDSDSENKHSVIVGFYPFQLGHGIALGDAYAVNPGLLGFYSDNVVDQYAPGMVITGDLIKDVMSYDLYGAILENRSDSFSSNAEPIYAQRYYRRNCPERGFGSIDWLAAARVQVRPVDNKEYGTLDLEPYILYNRAPEQQIEFRGDAESRLTTAGLSVDYQRGNFECSAEAARNFGKQHFVGWDRNAIVTQLDPATGNVQHVNSHVVVAATGAKAPDISANQSIINSSEQAQGQNGQLLTGGLLRNAVDRFTDPFDTCFKGWMAVADAGYWFYDRQIQLAGTIGIASGDDEDPSLNISDPRANPGDGDYDGFIGLQEGFTGGRVESAIFLGQRRTYRPLSLPNDAIQNGFYAETISEFTDLKFAGLGLHVKPQDMSGNPSWRPNILFFWQEDPTRAFNRAEKKVLTDKCARNFLGTEINSFFSIVLADCLTAGLVVAAFFPGAHYEDVQGVPVNKDQLKLLSSQIPNNPTPPLLGTDTAYMISAAIDYRY